VLYLILLLPGLQPGTQAAAIFRVRSVLHGLELLVGRVQLLLLLLNLALLFVHKFNILFLSRVENNNNKNPRGVEKDLTITKKLYGQRG
jgi:hypothetical protein